MHEVFTFSILLRICNQIDFRAISEYIRVLFMYIKKDLLLLCTPFNKIMFPRHHQYNIQLKKYSANESLPYNTIPIGLSLCYLHQFTIIYTLCHAAHVGGRD